MRFYITGRSSNIVEVEKTMALIQKPGHDGAGVFAELGTALVVAQLHGKPDICAVAREIPLARFTYHPARR